MKYPVTQFKSLAAALKEIEPFVRNGQHLQTGKSSANWLVCVAANAATEGKLTFCSDPVGGDGIICDAATGETWPTDVMVPRLRAGQTDDAETLILQAIDQKRDKGSAAYAAECCAARLRARQHRRAYTQRTAADRHLRYWGRLHRAAFSCRLALAAAMLSAPVANARSTRLTKRLSISLSCWEEYGGSPSFAAGLLALPTGLRVDGAG